VDASQWQRVKELFSSALEREQAQRNAFLADACGGDDSLRREVESLLAEHQQYTARPDGEIVRTDDANSTGSDSLAGRRIDPYQVVRRIGQGGMATVYLAMRADDQYRKLVAIKLIPSGLDNRELLRRFRNERQTLAALDHPNIVKLLDGGMTEDGIAYLVMDYIEGTSLDEYCDNHKLSISERLQLFRTVCAAVQYAHQRLVIHRDLKPGNILVTADGTVKLLDFGIAKVLIPEAAATLVVTRTGQRAMTPEYASPEQVRGEPLTNATDVYSLGVILYELLTGHHLYRPKSSMAEIERAICEEEPVQPSTVVTREQQKTFPDGTTQTMTADEICRKRESDPKKLRQQLHGDLDAIVMMSLRKEPQRRYASVYEFSEDIRKHLEGLPVKARPSSVIYHASKFLQRHRTASAIIAIFALLLAGAGGWYTSVRTRVASYGITPLKARRSIAVLGFKNLGHPEQAWLSTALSEMLTSEMAAGGKLRTIPEEDVAQTTINLSLPEADSYGKNTLAKLHENLGADFVLLGSFFDTGKDAGGRVRLDLHLQDTTAGETIAYVSETGTEAELLDLVSRTGAELRQKVGVGAVTAADASAVRASAPPNPVTARLYAEGLKRLRVYDALGARGLLEKAVAREPTYPMAHFALSEALAKLGYDAKAKEEAKTAFDLTTNLSQEDRVSVEARYRETTHEYERAVELYRTLFDLFPDNVDFGQRLANAQWRAGKGRDALVTVEALRKLPPPASDDPRIDLVEARVSESLGDFKREQAATVRAIRKAESLGASLLIAQAQSTQCWAFVARGQYQQARTACESAQKIYTRTGDRFGVAAALFRSAVARHDEGDLTGAQRTYEEAAAVFREIGDERDAGVALMNIGNVLSDRGDHVGAQRHHEEFLAISQKTGDKFDERLALANIATQLTFQGNLGEANATFRRALAIDRELGKKDAEVWDLEGLGNTLHLQGNLSEAGKMLEQSLEICRRIDAKPVCGVVLFELGNLLESQGTLREAKAKFQEALAIQKEIGVSDDAAKTQVALVELSIEEGHAEDADALLRDAREVFRKQEEIDREMWATSVLARALLAQGKSSEGRTEIDAASAVTARLQNEEVRLKFALAAAAVRAASGRSLDCAAALKNIGSTVAEATKHGYVGYEYRGRLATGEIEIKCGHTPIGRVNLAALKTEAQTKGFGLIAQKAALAIQN
jgi:serine/threonine protein kinase/tetratricopeptide (TPR) repeat protein